MSRLCVKPTCSDLAVRWFDIVPAQCRVIERAEASASSLSLCVHHAARFSAPDGWVVDGLVPESPVVESPVSEAPVPDSSPSPSRRRKHDRDAPWFLAGSAPSATAFSVAPIQPVAPLLPALDDDSEDAARVHAPSAGSLLHRAFHGPDREIDVARAKTAERDSSPTDVADVEDLSTRRAERNEPDAGCDIELPFPPFEPTRHIAVS